MSKFIRQLKGWPTFVWDARAAASVLSEVAFKEGELLGRLGEIGFENKSRRGFFARKVPVVQRIMSSWNRPRYEKCRLFRRIRSKNAESVGDFALTLACEM